MAKLHPDSIETVACDDCARTRVVVTMRRRTVAAHPSTGRLMRPRVEVRSEIIAGCSSCVGSTLSVRAS